jgi:outer membrane protein OmpA-like peptidoglycan-associated protein
MRALALISISLPMLTSLAGCGAVQLTNQGTPPVVRGAAAPPAPTPPPSDAPAAVVNDGKIEINQAILFETDRATIRGESSAILDQVVAVMREHAEIRRLRVEGHTDARGNAARNLTLSRERAAAVVAYLQGHGVTATLDSDGFGMTRPLCPETTDECYARNRRVEFVIVDPPR